MNPYTQNEYIKGLDELLRNMKPDDRLIIYDPITDHTYQIPGSRIVTTELAREEMYFVYHYPEDTSATTPYYITDTYVMVYYQGGLYKLVYPSRPYGSTDLMNELAMGHWELVSGGAAADPQYLDDLVDVNVTGAVAGRVLYRNATEWIAKQLTASDVGALDQATADGLYQPLGSYEPAFSKNTGFNLDLGVTAGTVAEGDHGHYLNDLLDVNTAGAANGQALVKTATGYEFQTVGGSGGAGTTYTGAKSIELVGTSFELDGDASSPGVSKYYGTDATGAKGFWTVPQFNAADFVKKVEAGTLDLSYNTTQKYLSLGGNNVTLGLIDGAGTNGTAQLDFYNGVDYQQAAFWMEINDANKWIYGHSNTEVYHAGSNPDYGMFDYAMAANDKSVNGRFAQIQMEAVADVSGKAEHFFETEQLSSGTQNRYITQVHFGGTAFDQAPSFKWNIKHYANGGTTNLTEEATFEVKMDGLYWNGSLITFGGGGGATTLDGLSDVTITAPANGNVLQYSNGSWVNTALSGAYVQTNPTGAQNIEQDWNLFTITNGGFNNFWVDGGDSYLSGWDGLVGTTNTADGSRYMKAEVRYGAYSIGGNLSNGVIQAKTNQVGGEAELEIYDVYQGSLLRTKTISTWAINNYEKFAQQFIFADSVDGDVEWEIRPDGIYRNNTIYGGGSSTPITTVALTDASQTNMDLGLSHNFKWAISSGNKTLVAQGTGFVDGTNWSVRISGCAGQVVYFGPTTGYTHYLNGTTGAVTGVTLPASGNAVLSGHRFETEIYWTLADF